MEAALTDRNSPIERWMRLYWMARQRIADLIRCGEFEDADRLLTKLAEAGSWLVEGSGAGRSLGKAILRATADLTNQYIETRAAMAADLLRSVQ